MKPIKGLNKDVRPSEQPEGTYPHGKNGIQYDLKGAVINEPGFRKLNIPTPYRYNGIIETDGKPVVFSTDNTNSAIGYFDPITETYIPIVNDATWSLTPAKLGFSTDFYITGQSQRNYKGELVIAFTDKDKYPKYLNCDNPNLRSIDDLRLFAFFRPPVITLQEALGGRLEAGAYYVAIGYERNDGTSAPYSGISEVAIIKPGAIAGINDKALQITISNADTNYDLMRVAIISKINGVTNVVELTDYLPVVTGIVDLIYTGDNLSTTIDIKTILTPPALYSKVQKIGQLNDYLYLADLEIEPDLNDMQLYANMVGLEWVSELIDATAPPPEHVNGSKRSRMHQEVYCGYIRYRKTRGGFTKWFNVPGLAPQAGDLVASTEAVNGGETTAVPVFKVEDTIRYFDPIGKTGACGTWINASERYPNTADFNSSAIGGPDLRNQFVRHHKMPSLRWCKTNLYPTEDDYGRKKLDILGLRAINVRIPTKYQGIIDGYEIGYAVRTVGNMTVYGQSVLMHGVTNRFENGQPTGNIPIYTSGGNWTTSVWHNGDSSFDNNNELAEVRFDTMRFHAFDLLFNRPSISPTFASAQFVLRRNNLRNEGYVEDADTDGSSGAPSGPTSHLVDYTLGIIPRQLPAGTLLRKLKSSFYLTNSINANNFTNSRHENCYAGYLLGNNWSVAHGDSGIRTKKAFTEANIGSPDFEEAYLVNLIAVKLDIYTNFYSQNIASAGLARDLTDGSTFWAGDTFCSDYTFHTYGRHETNDLEGEGNKGIKVVRRIVCESIANIALRYEITGNIYSKWYPHNSLPFGDPTAYITVFDRSQDPNQFGYTKDFNAINDLLNSTIFSPFREEVTKFPFRIHRGGKISREGRPRSWRTFLPLDYYEVVKNMGRIMNLEGMDDKLIIHFENSIYITQDKSHLDGTGIKVTLGTGDIFQFEPQPVEDSKLGIGGTQHDLACVKTPFGYIFVDAKIGEIYLYKGKLNLLNQDMNIFLREFLKLTDKNIFAGNGITIGYDQKYKRILVTVKNQLVNGETVVKKFEDTTEFWDNLEVGDVVWYNNRYIQYQGVNDSVYNCPADPPVVVITWESVDPECMLNDASANTGYVQYANRRRLKDGVFDGYTEPNTSNGGLGTYFPPVLDTDTCPPPEPVTTWVGKDGHCLVDDEFSCNTGYTLSEDNSVCTKVNSMPATPPTGGGGTPGTVGKAQNYQWNGGGARVYQPGFPLSGEGVVEILLTVPHFWVNGGVPFAGDGGDITTSNFFRNNIDSRMNKAGIWLAGHEGDGSPVDEWIGFSRKVTVTSAKTVYVGMSADNMFKININGHPVVDLTPSSGNLGGGVNFNYFNIYPVDLISGDNYIEMYAKNSGGPAGFAAEVYDNTLAELEAALSESDLNIIFSTKDMVGELFDLGETIGYNCPGGWALNTDGGVYTCKQILTQTPTHVDGGNTGEYGFDTRCRAIDGVEDGYCETNDNPATGLGTFVPPVENSTCIDSPPAPTPITVTGTLLKLCDDTDCTEQGEIALRFTFSSPTLERLVLLIGMLEIYNDGRKAYVGSDIFTPPMGAVPDSYYADLGVNVPFSVVIPPGTSTIDIHPFIYQKGATSTIAPWVCHNCLFPITDLYVKIDPTELSTTSPYTYTLNLHYVDPSITLHNIP